MRSDNAQPAGSAAMEGTHFILCSGSQPSSAACRSSQVLEAVISRKGVFGGRCLCRSRPRIYYATVLPCCGTALHRRTRQDKSKQQRRRRRIYSTTRACSKLASFAINSASHRRGKTGGGPRSYSKPLEATSHLLSLSLSCGKFSLHALSLRTDAALILHQLQKSHDLRATALKQRKQMQTLREQPDPGICSTHI